MEADKGFWLTLDEATGVLRASFNPLTAPPRRADIEAAVMASGWTLDALDEAAVETFLQNCQRATQSFAAEVGQVSDGAFTLELAADAMSVLLTLTGPRGGAHVREDEVLQALTERGIIFGLRKEALRAALAVGQCTDVIVAAGLAPEPGAPTRFESLLDAAKPHLPTADDDDTRVDYRNMGQLFIVPAGAPLMRRIPAVQGKDGINVLNEPVPALPVADELFTPDLIGVAPDQNDPCLLRATLAGAPVLLARGVLVNPVVEVEAVDLTSGNIDFEGTLRVKGDVTAGMKIQVKGDVYINGTMEGASVEAGGNVVVKGGIIGSSEYTRDAVHNAERVAHITCGGSLQARFIVNAVVSAGQNVMVENEILSSDIAAGDSVIVGQARGRRGNITGGWIRASSMVCAATLGAPAGTPTRIQAGVDVRASAHQLALVNTHQSLTEEKAKLEQLFKLFRLQPEKAANGIGERARQTHAKITAELEAIEARQAQLIQAGQPNLNAAIEARQRLHGGVTLNINGKMLEILEDRIGGKAQLEQDQIVIR